MCIVACSLTVYFENPFWVGVYERREGGRLEACRIVFGAEPKDCDLYAYLLQNWHRMRFSPPVRDERKPPRVENPKRAQRAVRRQLAQTGAGTKAMLALQLQREERKLERKAVRSEKSEEAEERRFALRQAHKREKHRGR